MKQHERRAFVLGDGCGVIKEHSHLEDQQTPTLLLMIPIRPALNEYPATPAQSIELYDSQVKELYDALHTYYNKGVA